jgi:hypothetical protein
MSAAPLPVAIITGAGQSGWSSTAQPRSMRLLKRRGPRATPPIPATNAKGSHHASRQSRNGEHRRHQNPLQRSRLRQADRPDPRLDHLALDQDVVLAGFSMGTGEVTRYFGRYGSAGVSKAILLGVIPPFLLQTEDNPKGVPGSVFEDIKHAILADWYAYFDDFLASFYNTDDALVGPPKVLSPPSDCPLVDPIRACAVGVSSIQNSGLWRSRVLDCTRGEHVGHWNGGGCSWPNPKRDARRRGRVPSSHISRSGRWRAPSGKASPTRTGDSDRRPRSLGHECLESPRQRSSAYRGERRKEGALQTRRFGSVYAPSTDRLRSGGRVAPWVSDPVSLA